MANAELELKGLDRLQARLAAYANEIPAICEDALREEAEIEKTESMQRTPVDTGALRGSHTVETRRRGNDISATIGVGGPAAPYAFWVHENEDVFHPVGQAKFLESTILESKPYLASRLAARIRAKLRAR
jgi:hypothetical protein